MSRIIEFLYMIISCSCCYEEDFIRHTQLENRFYEDYPNVKSENLHRRKNKNYEEIKNLDGENIDNIV